MKNFQFPISKFQVAIFAPLLMIFLLGCDKKVEPVDISRKESSGMRIISMAPNLTEILFALGLDEEIVGVSEYSNYPEQAQTKKNIGSFWQPDIESVLKLKPTLVVTLAFEQQAVLASRLKRIGCKTLTVDIESIEQLYSAIEEIGIAVDRKPQAQQMLDRLKSKQQAIAQRVGQSEKPKVLWVIQRDPLRVAGTTTFVNELIELTGGVNAVGDTLQIYPPVSTENVIRAMPEVIIEPTMDPAQLETQKNTVETFYRRFHLTPAVKSKRIYVIDGDLVSRLGPRLDEAMELIYNCIHSEQEK